MLNKSFYHFFVKVDGSLYVTCVGFGLHDFVMLNEIKEKSLTLMIKRDIIIHLKHRQNLKTLFFKLNILGLNSN
jgi:hypothetical protein